MAEATQVPWPAWLLRYLACENEESFEDLIWSVGGSPPYGGVSYEEGAAVYELLEQYRGPGRAPESAYQKLRKLIAKISERLDTLEAFHCYDEIVSSPESYSIELVERGLALSRKLEHNGAEARFLALKANLQYRWRQISEARRTNMEALKLYLELADADPAYRSYAAAISQNAVSFTAMDGDIAGARELLEDLREIFDATTYRQLQNFVTRGQSA